MRIVCVCCKATCCPEETKQRMFRKARKKVDRDLNLVDLIRNQKILIAAVSSMLEENKFNQIVRDYYFGNVSSGDDKGIKSEWFWRERIKGAKTLEDLDERRENESMYPTPRSRETRVINL